MDNPLEPHRMLDLIAILVTVIINAALCAADKRPLKRAGYEDMWPIAFGEILAPV